MKLINKKTRTHTPTHTQATYTLTHITQSAILGENFSVTYAQRIFQGRYFLIEICVYNSDPIQPLSSVPLHVIIFTHTAIGLHPSKYTPTSVYFGKLSLRITSFSYLCTNPTADSLLKNAQNSQKCFLQKTFKNMNLLKNTNTTNVQNRFITKICFILTIFASVKSLTECNMTCSKKIIEDLTS